MELWTTLKYKLNVSNVEVTNQNAALPAIVGTYLFSLIFEIKFFSWKHKKKLHSSLTELCSVNIVMANTVYIMSQFIFAVLFYHFLKHFPFSIILSCVFLFFYLHILCFTCAPLLFILTDFLLT